MTSAEPTALPIRIAGLSTTRKHGGGFRGGRFFPSPTYHPEAPFPHIEDGRCVIEHHLYNDYHRDSPKTTFLGGEIRSAVEFDPSRAYRFEARVKGNVFPGGLVTSFFTYGYDGAVSDEIDFEFLSNHVNDNATYPKVIRC